MNGNNYRNSHHHRNNNQYLVAEQQQHQQQHQQQFGAACSNNNNGAKHLQADPALVASSRGIGAIYNGLPMQNHHNHHKQHQQQRPQQNLQHSTIGFHQANGSNSRHMKGLVDSDYSMPPMPISSSSSSTATPNSASVNQLTDQLSQTHLDHQHQDQYQSKQHRHQYYHQNQPSNQHRSHASTVNGNSKSPDANEAYQHYAPARHQHPEEGVDAESLNMDYANQLRQSQYRHKYQQQHQIEHNPNQQHYHNLALSGNNHNAHNYQSNGKHSDNNEQRTASYDSNFSQKVGNLNPDEEQQQSTAKSTMHVNFNRCSRPGKPNGQSGEPGDDEAESPGRKKKYLTAKYGQQQMNLIKKRLKVEMWLFEQLKELAKGTKSEDDLDEIDIDLDQILDMEDDVARRNWLKKLLQPYDDLPADRVDKFICDVIEQSRLL